MSFSAPTSRRIGMNVQVTGNFQLAEEKPQVRCRLCRYDRAAVRQVGWHDSVTGPTVRRCRRSVAGGLMIKATRADGPAMWRRRQTDTSAADTPLATVTFFAAATPVESDTFFVTQASAATDAPPVTDDLGPTDTSEATHTPQAIEAAGTADTPEVDSNSKAFSRFRARSKTIGTPEANDALPATDDLGPTDTSEATHTPQAIEAVGTARHSRGGQQLQGLQQVQGSVQDHRHPRGE